MENAAQRARPHSFGGTARQRMDGGANDPLMARQPRDFMLRRLDEANEDDLGDDDADPEGDEEDDMVVPEDGEGENDRASRGSGFRLVLLPTILLGSIFTICVICRYCRKSNDDVVFNQVEEYLSSFDDDDTSAIELRSDAYSDEDASRASSRASSQPREPSFPRPTSTQADEGEIA